MLIYTASFCIRLGSSLEEEEERERGRGGQGAHWCSTMQCNTSMQLRGERLGRCMAACLPCATSAQGREFLLWNPHGVPSFQPRFGTWKVCEQSLRGRAAKLCFLTGCSLCLSSWVDVAHQRDSDLKSQFIQAVVVSLPHLISGKLAVFLKLKPFCYISLKWISGLQGTEDRTDFICLFWFCFAVSSDV